MLTTECVTPKHPDKMCDRIVDRVLDQIREKDPAARCAFEMVAGHGQFSVVGEVTAQDIREEDIRGLFNAAVSDIADEPNPIIHISVVQQSPEIAQGVDTGGAGDQGIMVGFACDDNHELVPQEHYLARSLCKYLYERFPVDGKTQITLGDDMEVTAIVASLQGVTAGNIEDNVNAWAAELGLDITAAVKHYNPAGDWIVGGFDADSGMNGRKVVVDAYGTRVAVGGGAFSGKDFTKVDRSGAYAARSIACQLVGYDVEGVRDIKEATVKIAYAIGVAEPVDIFGEVVYQDDRRARITKTLLERYNVDTNLTPLAIRERFNLDKIKYEKTAEWGAFGNGFPWDSIHS